MDHNICNTILRCFQAGWSLYERYAQSTWKADSGHPPATVKSENTRVPPRKATRTAFFDLPLELRQTVYGYMLPSDRTINFPLHRQEEKTVFAVCATHKVLCEELEMWMYRECSASLNITPDVVMEDINELPMKLEWYRFQRIDIRISYYQGSGEGRAWDPWPSGTRLRQAVASLRHGHPSELPNLTICFVEDTTLNIGDSEWTEEIPEGRKSRWTGCCDEIDHDWSNYKEPAYEYSRPEHYRLKDSDSGSDSGEDEYVRDYRTETWVRTRSHTSEPLVARVLDHFVDLPPCRLASVRRLSYLDKDYRDGEHDYDPEARTFDDCYMTDLCNALEFWLEGRRDGIDIDPRRDDLYFNRTELERLAYRHYVGGWYCDGAQPQPWERYTETLGDGEEYVEV
ncbi:hypothetical protein LTR09_010814 [Extremus antarcticus]|uniref:Uncharacterized protein n=1 Tax=Extremus antarcticus TaxID=702011 RepID=A0AAJ0G5D8_9PEZI|nr:hypothetical protein LTR09_010814 [Extremus antarcticus]